MKKKKKKTNIRTISSYIHSNDAHKIFEHMTSITKNIFNHTLFCQKVFNLFRNDIFKNVYYFKYRVVVMVNLWFADCFNALNISKFYHFIFYGFYLI